jgi:predicted Co/Zn/Cd cation transporter (cation efflux family)
MGKTLFGVSAAALMVAFAVGWAIPNTQARDAAATSAQVDPFQLMTGAKQMPSERFADYSLVF